MGCGVDLEEVGEQLEREGLHKFEQSWRQLGETVSGALQPA
jgi:transaldolase